MNSQLSQIANMVRTAVKTIEVTRRKDFQALVTKMDQIRKSEMRHLKRRVDEVRRSLNRVEELKPYMAAIEAAARELKKTRKAAKPTRRRARKRASKS